jgi:hypothetical protein
VAALSTLYPPTIKMHNLAAARLPHPRRLRYILVYTITFVDKLKGLCLYAQVVFLGGTPWLLANGRVINAYWKSHLRHAFLERLFVAGTAPSFSLLSLSTSMSCFALPTHCVVGLPNSQGNAIASSRSCPSGQYRPRRRGGEAHAQNRIHLIS